MPNNQASQWPILFDLAGNIVDHFQATNGFIPDWTFGGGTALMLQIDHRERGAQSLNLTPFDLGSSNWLA